MDYAAYPLLVMIDFESDGLACGDNVQFVLRNVLILYNGDIYYVHFCILA